MRHTESIVKVFTKYDPLIAEIRVPYALDFPRVGCLRYFLCELQDGVEGVRFGVYKQRELIE